MMNRRLSRNEYVVLLGTERCQCEPFGWSFLESTLDLKPVLNPNLLNLLMEDYPPGKRGSRRWPLKRLKSAVDQRGERELFNGYRSLAKG
jgi:hypothetical protein